MLVWRLAWRRARVQVHDLEGLLAAARLEVREALVGWRRQSKREQGWYEGRIQEQRDMLEIVRRQRDVARERLRE
jgi:hypothetical protein